MYLVNLWAANHDKTVWRYPDSFDIRNFVSENPPSETPTLNHSAMENLASFGFGKRRCLGEKLALSLLYLILSGILRKYQVKPVDGKQINEEQLIRLDVVPNDYSVIFQDE